MKECHFIWSFYGGVGEHHTNFLLFKWGKWTGLTYMYNVTDDQNEMWNVPLKLRTPSLKNLINFSNWPMMETFCWWGKGIYPLIMTLLDGVALKKPIIWLAVHVEVGGEVSSFSLNGWRKENYTPVVVFFR